MASSRAAASLICRPSSCPLPVPVAATMLSLSHISTGRPRFLASTSAYTPASSPSSTSGEYFLNTTCPSAAVKISSASPWRMRWVRLISLGMTTRPSSSDCVNQVQKIFVKPRKALKYKNSSAFGAFTPVLLIESF